MFDGVVEGSAETASVEGIQLGTLDEFGHYTAAPRALSHDFEVVREEGEWRIGAPLPGVMLSRYIFQRYYDRVPLYFMSRAGSHVVPDPVHMPETQVTPTAIVDAVLSGPSAGIAQAVSDAVPSGVSLSDEGATIDPNGVVTVVTSNGFPFTLPGARADGVLELAGQQGYQILSRASTVDLFGVREGVPGRVTGDGGFDPWGAVGVTAADLAVSLDGDTTAVIDDTGNALLMGPMRGELAAVPVPYTNLRAPQFVLGTLWLLGDDSAGVPRLITVDRFGSVDEVELTLPPGAILDQFAVSPARARIALLVSTGEIRSLGIGTVLSTGRMSVADWRPLPMIAASGVTLGDVSAVAWHAETAIAVAAMDSGVRSIFATEVDGSLVEELGPFSGEVEELTAVARLGGGAIALRTDAGVTWRYEARTRWTRLGEGISAIAYAG